MSNYFSESIFKETPQKEEVVEKKREPVKEDFTYKNIVSLCGKIIKIYPSGKDGMIFVLAFMIKITFFPSSSASLIAAICPFSSLI